jgi:hypothetical protein
MYFLFSSVNHVLSVTLMTTFSFSPKSLLSSTAFTSRPHADTLVSSSKSRRWWLWHPGHNSSLWYCSLLHQTDPSSAIVLQMTTSVVQQEEDVDNRTRTIDTPISSRAFRIQLQDSKCQNLRTLTAVLDESTWIDRQILINTWICPWTLQQYPRHANRYIHVDTSKVEIDFPAGIKRLCIGVKGGEHFANL